MLDLAAPPSELEVPLGVGVHAADGGLVRVRVGLGLGLGLMVKVRVKVRVRVRVRVSAADGGHRCAVVVEAGRAALARPLELRRVVLAPTVEAAGSLAAADAVDTRVEVRVVGLPLRGLDRRCGEA